MTRAWVVLLCAGLAACGGEALPTGTSAIEMEPMARLDSAPVCTQSSHRGTYRLNVAPSLAVDNTGRAVVAWGQCDGSALRVAATWFDGRRWRSPVTLGRPTSAWPEAASAVTGGTVFWHETRAAGELSPAYYSTLDSRLGWSESRSFEPDGRAGAETLLDGGNTVVWSTFAPLGLRASRFQPGIGWTPPQTAVHHDDHVADSRVVGDAAGNAVAVFSGPDPDGADTRVRRPWSIRFDARTGWEPSRPIDTTPLARATNVLPAMNDAGEGYAAWEEDYAAIHVARYTTAHGWATPIHLDTGPTRRWSSPQVSALAVAARGNAHLLWRDTGELDIWATRLVDGRQEGPSVRLGEGHDVRLVTGADGTALAAWLSYGTLREPAAIHIRRYVVGRGWSPPETFTGSGGTLREFESPALEVGLDARGQVFVVWMEENGGRDELWVRRFRL